MLRLIKCILSLFFHLCVEDLADVNADVEADCFVPQQKSKFPVLQPDIMIIKKGRKNPLLIVDSYNHCNRLKKHVSTYELGPKTCLV